jgi:hypothetical protein
MGGFKADLRTKILFEEYDEALYDKDTFQLLDWMKVKISTFILPFLTQHSVESRTWLKTRQAKARSRRFAVLIAESQVFRKQPVYNYLIHRSGLSGPNRSLSTDGVVRLNDTFIVHSLKDSSAALILEAELLARGVTIHLSPIADLSNPANQVDLVACMDAHRHVAVICSETALNDPFFIFVIEAVLSREAREGGQSVLVPIAIDDYLPTRWTPSDRRLKFLRQALNDRVICELNTLATEESKASRLDNLAKALKIAKVR